MIYLIIDKWAMCPVYAFTNKEAAELYIGSRQEQYTVMEVPAEFHWKDL